MPATPFRPDIPIDRTSGTPLYSQIAEALATLILDGALEPGTRLEDEVSMARRLEVSRPTARQALQRLVDRGLISRRRGAGRARPGRLTSPGGPVRTTSPPSGREGGCWVTGLPRRAQRG